MNCLKKLYFKHLHFAVFLIGAIDSINKKGKNMKLQNTVLNSFTHTQLRNTHHKYVGICIDKPMFELQGVFQCRGNHVLKGAISKKKRICSRGEHILSFKNSI